MTIKEEVINELEIWMKDPCYYNHEEIVLIPLKVLKQLITKLRDEQCS